MKRFYTYITLCLLFLSCSDKNNELELALHYAGANRVELEKVLRHYEGDSLKHRAAVFLIENMSYHYGYDLNDRCFQKQRITLLRNSCHALFGFMQCFP